MDFVGDGDHPRLRGVDRRRSGSRHGCAGSSPLTRGRLELQPIHARRARIIPAYAGSTLTIVHAPDVTWDHPRLRGVDLPKSAIARSSNGSSPLTRGRLRSSSDIGARPRIIPAYAGSTQWWSRCESFQWDHPRLRGVDQHPTKAVWSFDGSSPLTRGRLTLVPNPPDVSRIIPAYAGSTTQTKGKPCSNMDHPRLRGVDPRTERTPNTMDGSSPLTRGRRGAPAVRDLRLGIIPAYAGSTGMIEARRGRFPDHPRLRGVDFPKYACIAVGNGSSPLTRGRRSLSQGRGKL